MMDCKHENFRADAEITRCTRSPEDLTVVVFYCELRVRCTVCDKPFEFIGLPMGMSPGQAMCSVDGQVARLPIKPVGEQMPLDVMGFGVEFHEA
jgi:hypothetical protein